MYENVVTHIVYLADICFICTVWKNYSTEEQTLKRRRFTSVRSATHGSAIYEKFRTFMINAVATRRSSIAMHRALSFQIPRTRRKLVIHLLHGSLDQTNLEMFQSGLRTEPAQGVMLDFERLCKVLLLLGFMLRPQKTTPLYRNRGADRGHVLYSTTSVLSRKPVPSKLMNTAFQNEMCLGYPKTTPRAQVLRRKQRVGHCSIRGVEPYFIPHAPPEQQEVREGNASLKEHQKREIIVLGKEEGSRLLSSLLKLRAATYNTACFIRPIFPFYVELYSDLSHISLSTIIEISYCVN